MKLIVFAFAIAAVSCAPTEPEPVPILKYENEGVNPDGSYQWSYETGDGISAQAQGVLKNAGTEGAETQEVSGSYSYTASDGSKIQVSYIANENGYQPTGEGIPTIPPAIQKALDWIAAHPEPEEAGKKEKI